MRDGALLAAFAGVLSLAAAQLTGRRASSSAARTARSDRPRPDRVAANRSAAWEASALGRGAAAAIAWVDMGLATVALLGQVVAPVADPLWIALLAVAFATVPAAALIGRRR